MAISLVLLHGVCMVKSHKINNDDFSSVVQLVIPMIIWIHTRKMMPIQPVCMILANCISVNVRICISNMFQNIVKNVQV